MVRGRPPQPQKVRELHGERRPSRTRVEPQPADRPPEPPGWLSVEARAVWERVTAELGAMGLAYAADADLLAGYASSVAVFAEAERALVVEGRIHLDDNGEPRRSPWVLIRRDALDSMQRLGAAFGLTPVARARLAAPAGRDEDQSAVLRLLS